MSESAHPALQPSPAVPAPPDPARAPSKEGAIAEPTTPQRASTESAVAASTVGQPAPVESAVGEPAKAPSAEVTATVAEPPPAPASAVDEPPAPAAVPADLPAPVAAGAELAPTSATMPWPGSSLFEGGIRLRSEMIAFTWRETEHGLALGRALLASRSLPEILVLQTAYLGETLERTVAHSLVLARLSTDLLRADMPSPPAD